MTKNHTLIVPDYGDSSHNHTCPKCGSANLLTGAGRRPGEMSLKCAQCGVFIRYIDTKNFEKLKKLRRRRKFTESVTFIECASGFRDENALFVLSEAGGVK